MIVVIGVGNPLRRDDGAGRAAAAVLARELTAHSLPTRLILVHQLTPEIAVELSDAHVDAVVFLDAAVGVESPSMHELSFPVDPAPGDAAQPPDPSSSAGASHQIEPQTILAYAGLLRAAPLRAWVIRMPVFDLAHGEGLSKLAQVALEALPALCRDLARRIG